MDRSMVANPGPCRVLRPAFPLNPLPGKPNAAVLTQLSGVRPPAGLVETPGTTSGRFTLSVLTSRSESPGMIGEKGTPLANVPTALTCQPPAKRDPLKGRSYDAFRTTLCLTSKSDRPQSRFRLYGSNVRACPFLNS